MRIDRLEVKNFKKFSQQAFTFDRKFTLLVGENGSGKTCVLDALAVALGVWLNKTPDSLLANSHRRIRAWEKRLEWVHHGDRAQFQEASGDVSIKATGQIEDRDGISWEQSIPSGAKQVKNSGAKEALTVVDNAFDRALSSEHVLLPVIAYYGAGRAWLPHHERSQKSISSKGASSRWAAFYDCLNERIRIPDLVRWFKDETIESANRGGRFRPGFEVVKLALLNCIPGADNVWFDVDRKDIVLSIDQNPQPFDNLSAGQSMMLAMVADIAIKAVTQNNFLVPREELNDKRSLPQVLADCPGVVLIDELDVHLHPRWQRRVASDLKRTFPKIQFVCTSHSPQVIGEVAPSEVRLLDEPHVGERPAHSRGLDSNAILEQLMSADARSIESEEAITAVEKRLDAGDLQGARSKLQELKALQNGETGDTSRLEATINNLEAAASAGD
jgi:predicted ATP-binding protein involved in virulence